MQTCRAWDRLVVMGGLDMRARVLVGAALLMACSDHVSIVAPTMSASTFEARLRAARCRQSARCGAIGASQVDRCISAAARVATHDDSSRTRSEVSGRSRIDVSEAERYLAAYDATSSCFDPAEIFPFAYVVPLVPVGGACEASDECIGGGCDKDLGCGGKCVAWPPTGGACSGFGACAPSDQCIAGVCVPLLGDGEPCTSFGQCQQGLECWIDEGATTGRCAGPAREGSSCASLGWCADGLYCDGICRPETAPGWLDVGAHCDFGSTSRCPESLPCNEGSETCVPRPSAVGSTCSGVCEDVLAYPPTFCDSTTSKCVARADLGEACVSSGVTGEACYAGDCDPTTGTCTRSCP